MAEHPYMPFFPEKFIADVQHIPWDAAGAYALLLVSAWARGGSLPNDRDQLRLIVRCHSRSWPRIWSQIAPFWSVGEDGRLHQKRMDKEWQRATEARAASAAAGRNGSRNGSRRSAETADLKHFSVRKRAPLDGKKPNDYYARARAVPATHNPHPYKEEEEERESPRVARVTRAQETLLHENWQPEKAEAQFAYDQGLSERDLASEVQRFRDTNRATGKRLADVPAAWRAWITSPHAPRNKGGSNGANRKPGPLDILRGKIERDLREAAENGEDRSILDFGLLPQIRH